MLACMACIPACHRSREEVASVAPSGVDLDAGARSVAHSIADPSLLQRLSAIAQRPQRLGDSSVKRSSEVRDFYEAAGAAIRSGKWREEKRTRCESDDRRYGANVEGKAVATNERGSIRALTILGGTDDNHQEARLFFDDAEQLRLLFTTYADVQGGIVEHLVYFDARGDVLVCDRFAPRQGMPGPDLCANEAPPAKVDPAVASALRQSSPAKARNSQREALQAIRAREEFEKCKASGND